MKYLLGLGGIGLIMLSFMIFVSAKGAMHEATAATVLSAGLICMSAAVLATAIDTHEEKARDRAEYAAKEFKVLLNSQLDSQKLLSGIIAEAALHRKATEAVVEQVRAQGERTNQLLEWLGEIQGETLRAQKKASGAPPAQS